MGGTSLGASLLLWGQTVLFGTVPPDDLDWEDTFGEDAATAKMSLLQNSLEWGQSHFDRVDASTIGDKADRSGAQELLHRMLKVPTSKHDRHPFWVFDWAQLRHAKVLLGGCLLFVAGVLSAAGGIGGGGIYVSVLILTVPLDDAVPLSKAIVFIGSIVSLIMNVRKGGLEGGQKKLIDYNVCSLVVPAALIGTYLGVLLNWFVPGRAILSILTAVLIGMTVRLIKMTKDQYSEEICGCTPPALDRAGEANDSRAGGTQECGWKAAPRYQVTVQDMILGGGTLFFVVVSGTLRFHASVCEQSLASNLGEECHHPAMFFLQGKLQAWMQKQQTASIVEDISFALPLCACLLVAAYYTHKCVSEEAWRLSDTFSFQAMAAATGCLAGLVGIGGGLIFSPFFLLMGMDAHVAVATSSTCVIFTASSTALQYLLTDRVIMSLTVFYGVVSLLASFIGTSFVHRLQDTCATRRSYVTCIVAVGVAISTVLSCMKLVEGFVTHEVVD